MSLRQQAAADSKAIVEDSAAFGWPVTVTNPAGVSANLTGLCNDVSATIDPDTGQAVTGRSASVALSIASLTAAGLGQPVGVAESLSKPWLVSFNDINGNLHKFKVAEALPDRSIGLVVCLLELYT